MSAAGRATVAGRTVARAAWLASLLASSIGFAAEPLAEDIRDIRGPKPLASGWLTWALIGAAAAAALAAYALWRWLKRRREQAPQPSHLEVALARLESARALMHPGGGREFSIEVSGAVREYIESRFGVMAAHRTTHEFLHDLMDSSSSGLTHYRDLLGQFLQSCDLAKFGGWSLSTEQMATMLDSARRFVRSAASGPSQPPQPADPPDAGSHPASGKAHVSLPSA
jgi:hypothetical protein